MRSTTEGVLNMQKEIIKNLLSHVANPCLVLATMDLPAAQLEAFYMEFFGSVPNTFHNAEGLTLAQSADLEARQLGYSGLDEVLSNMNYDNSPVFEG
jgi:hypothetical protein